MKNALGFACVSLSPSVISVVRTFIVVISCAVALSVATFAADQTEGIKRPAGTIFLKVQLNSSVKVSALKSGEVVEGTLARTVYAGDREIFPAGRPVRLTVAALSQRRRVPNDHWPWVIRLFTPRHENYPSFDFVRVSAPDGSEVPLKVSLLSIGQKLEAHAQSKVNSPQSVTAAAAPIHAEAGKQIPSPIVALEAELPGELAGTSKETNRTMPSPATLAAGTPARIMLMGGVSASESRPGDAIQARLAEPVRVGSEIVLPEGSLLQGRVVKSMRPRWLSRSGSLLLTFTGLTLPGGSGTPVTASVAGAEIEKGSQTRVDSEGQLKGGPAGKAWMLANFSATAGIGKATDDGLQLVIEAIASTATDASTAGVGRIVALCASGVFMVTRHGRDVILPKFTEMDVMFDRPVKLAGVAPNAAH